jgi:hypothetical protein
MRHTERRGVVRGGGRRDVLLTKVANQIRDLQRSATGLPGPPSDKFLKQLRMLSRDVARLESDASGRGADKWSGWYRPTRGTTDSASRTQPYKEKRKARSSVRARDLDLLQAAFLRGTSARWPGPYGVGRVSTAVVEGIGAEAARAATTSMLWCIVLGPYVSAAEVAEAHRQSEESITQEVQTGTLAGIVGPTATYLPRWQFEVGTYDVSETAKDVIEVFRKELGSGCCDSVVAWASTQQSELGGQEPRDVMIAEHLEALIRSARKATRGQ